jgi:hypothetical protein
MMSVMTESSLILESYNVFWMRWIMAAAFAHEPLAGSQEITHVPRLFVGHETASNQARSGRPAKWHR